MKKTLIPLVDRTIQRSPVLLQATGKATALMRNLAIKRYIPSRRTREFKVGGDLSNLLSHHAHIYREKGAGSIPTIIIGGFVPDATEVIEFQRNLLKEFGSIYYLNYRRQGYSSELLSAQIADLIEDLNRRGERPVLFGISFGAGVVVDFLRTFFRRENLNIRGVIFISPVFCTADLVRPEGERTGGVRMLESSLRRILKAGAKAGEDMERQVERARRCFQSLFETGAENRRLTGRHLAIRKDIMDVIEKTPAVGGYERMLALQAFSPLVADETIFSGPVLTLLAEGEENLLVPTSPTLALCHDSGRFGKIFPRGICRRVTSGRQDDPVVHASLIFHHKEFNPLIASWYNKLLPPKIFAVV